MDEALTEAEQDRIFDAMVEAFKNPDLVVQARYAEIGRETDEVLAALNAVEGKRGDGARLPARWVDVVGRRGAWSFGPALWSTLAMTRRTAAIGV